MKRAIVLAALIPSAALAHGGDHSHVSLMHLLAEPDHLAMIAGAVAVGFGIYRLWVRR